MRRRLSVLTLSILSLLLVALPASAAEEGADEATGIIGSFEGLALAAVLGIVVGIVVFAASQGGPADEPDEHH